MIFNKLQKMLFLVVMIFMTTTGVFAQNEIASPYSRFGLGSMNTNKSNTALQGMAGLANSLPFCRRTTAIRRMAAIMMRTSRITNAVDI